MGIVEAVRRVLSDVLSPIAGAPGLGLRVQESDMSLGHAWHLATDWASGTLFTIGSVPITAFGIISVIVIITLSWWLSKLAQGALTRIAHYRPNFSRAALYALNRVMHYIILAIGFLIALSSLGIDFSKLALFASALGVGVGFGLQNLISNFVAGLMLLFERTLKVGDFIELQSGLMGEVREINIRSTLITTNDNVDVVVPNSEFVSGHVMNWTMRDVNRRVHVPFGVAYGSDKDLVRKAALEAAANVKHTLTGEGPRAPQVWLTAFGDSSLNFELVVWLTSDGVKRPSAVQAEYLWAIETALGKYGIEIPFPQRDLHVRSWSPEARLPGKNDPTRD
jgi:small-conductance mechanosensitive channel